MADTLIVEEVIGSLQLPSGRTNNGGRFLQRLLAVM